MKTFKQIQGKGATRGPGTAAFRSGELVEEPVQKSYEAGQTPSVLGEAMVARANAAFEAYGLERAVLTPDLVGQVDRIARLVGKGKMDLRVSFLIDSLIYRLGQATESGIREQLVREFEERVREAQRT